MNSKQDFLNLSQKEFYKELNKYKSKLKPTKEIEGFPASAIIGSKTYSNVKVHSISNEDKAGEYKNIGEIAKKTYSEIFKTKARNIFGSTKEFHIKTQNKKIKEDLTDIYKAKNPVEFSSKFENYLHFDKIVLNKTAGIIGSKNELKSIDTTGNLQTSKSIENFSTKDIKAREAIISLYKKGISEHQIINLLSLGTFGINFNKKIVPTKWAISAFDQTIERHLHKEIINFKEISHFEIYEYTNKGNEFIIILHPHYFLGEVIESFLNKGRYIIEYDYIPQDNSFKLQTPQTAGGFWATKLGIHEHLIKRKKQAAYTSIRIIEGYDIPLGVVLVRECIREALLKAPVFKSSNEDEMSNFLMSNFPNHYTLYKEKSKIPNEMKKQSKLDGFF